MTEARHLCVNHLREVFDSAADINEVIEDCALIISELVTNAVIASDSLVSVDVSVHRDYIRLSVTDDGAGGPQVLDAGPTDTHGRGLRIVGALARSSGVIAKPQGKEVWAELPLRTGDWRFECHLPVAG